MQSSHYNIIITSYNIDRVSCKIVRLLIAGWLSSSIHIAD